VYGSNDRIIAWALLALLAACGDRQPAQRPAAVGEPAGDGPPVVARDHPTIVFLGTSITAGLGLDPDQAYPAVIQRRIDSAGLPYTVINAGVSGESSAGALHRIDWILRQPPAVLVIETGANDGLRGQDPDSMRANIQSIISRVRDRSPNTRIVLVGMEALPNLGADYARRFRAVYPELAQLNNVPLVLFLLDQVAGVDSLNQQDGIHPNQRGAVIVAETMWRVLRPILR
jgi:acyl-CoA thioesterase-1